MKKLLLLWLMIAPMSGMAQNESTPQDTTLYVNGRKIVIKEQGDKIKVKLYESASGGDTITNAQIFEGVYLNGQSTESRTVLSALPFSKKNNKRNRFEPHAGGFYIGYTRLSNDFLSFNPSNGADLNTSIHRKRTDKVRDLCSSQRGRRWSNAYTLLNLHNRLVQVS